MTLNTATILRRTASLVAAHPLPGLLWTIVLAALGTAMDMLTGGDALYLLGYCLAALFGQFLLTSALLRGEDMHHAWGRPGRAVSFFGLSVVIELAIFLGLLLLVLPGLYLSGRWLVAAPLVIGEGSRMSEALRISWERTRTSAWAITRALVLMFLPTVAGTVWMFFGYPDYGPVPIGLALAVNVLCSISCIIVWYAAVAIYLAKAIETAATLATD